mmetsp:Transcript_33661/g.86249  ORF Transcript_33661/g.86249 Transcript_33661/m.86249 type:complete len:237 (+) Transcript_33661:917-1627(+)
MYRLSQHYLVRACGRSKKRGKEAAMSVESGTSAAKAHRRTRVWSGLSVLYLVEGQMKVWYWDVLLFYRRAAYELVYVFVPVGVSQQAMFVALTTLFSYLHARHDPYLSRVANYTEALSYTILLFVNVLSFPSIVFSVVTLQQTSESRAFLYSLSRIQSVFSFLGLLLLGVVIAIVYGLKFAKWVRATSPHRRTYARIRSLLSRHVKSCTCKKQGCKRKRRHLRTKSTELGDTLLHV